MALMASSSSFVLRTPAISCSCQDDALAAKCQNLRADSTDCLERFGVPEIVEMLRFLATWKMQRA